MESHDHFATIQCPIFGYNFTFNTSLADVHSDVHVPFYLDFLFGEFVFAFCSSNKIILGVQTETIFIMLTICQSPF